MKNEHKMALLVAVVCGLAGAGIDSQWGFPVLLICLPFFLLFGILVGWLSH